MSGDDVTQLRTRRELGAAHVLLVDADPAAYTWLRTIVAGHFGLETVHHGVEALELLSSGNSRLVIVGAQLLDMTGAELVEQAAQWLEGDDHAPLLFLLANDAGHSPKVDDAKIKVFYRLVRTMKAERVRELFAQAAVGLGKPPPLPPDPKMLELVAKHAKAIGSAHKPADAALEAIKAVIQLLGVDRARCLFCDEDSGALWSGLDDNSIMTDSIMSDGHELQDSHISGGLTGFAVRTGTAIALPRAKDEPIYRQENDDPVGNGSERIVVQPVAGEDGHVHAVLVAVRLERKPMFTTAELDKLEALASAWAPYLVQMSSRLEEDAKKVPLETASSDIFRQEAIDSLVKKGSRGDVVRVHPGWIRSAYWLVLASLIGASAFAAVARVHEYAEGPAIVRFTGRSDVVAFEAGTIAALEVKRGQTVVQDQVLARLHDTEQVTRLRGLETEFERKLVAYLQTPADPAVRQALAQVVSQRETARAGVESRVIRAPHAGIIKEVLVRNGQRVEPGKVVLTIVESASTEGLSVLAFLPGTERPRLHPHQHLRLTLPGYRGAHIGGEVRAVSSDIVGATEARTRYLGERLGESLPISGTVVVVEAFLSSPDFESDGQRYQLHDGMLGVAEVQLESRTVLETVIPGLKR